MDFNEKGFLGTQIDEFSQSVQKRYSGLFELAHRINELAHATKFELKVHDHDPQEFIAATIFLRLLNGFEATVILGIKGLLFEAKVVLRSVIESLFILRLLCKEEAFALEYLETSKVQSLKWMNIAHQSKDPNFESVRRYATPQIMKGLEDEIKQRGLKKLAIKSIAERAGIPHIYDAHYRLLSEQVHCLPISINPFMVRDQKGGRISFEWGPKHEDLDFVLFTDIQILLTAMVAITELFGLDKEDELKEIDKGLTTLALTLGSESEE